MKTYTQKEFMKLANINNRQRLHQLMNSYFRKDRKGKLCNVKPILIEGKDFKKSEIVFFESAVEKVKNIKSD